MADAIAESAPALPALAAAKKSDRLLSLDALRGFNMLWIIGLDDAYDRVMELVGAPGWLADQATHAKWGHFHCYDLIMPLFVFVMGAAIPLAVHKHKASGDSDRRIHLHLLRRALTLVVLGMVYNGALRLAGFHETRFASVLGFIGVTYALAALIVLHCRPWAQVVWMAGILLAYWGAIEWVPVADIVKTGLGGKEGYLSAWVDQHFLPGRLYGGSFDPEGILPMLAGVSITLLGSLAGEWIERTDRNGHQKAAGLLGAAAACLGLGLLMGLCLPIVKSVWTPSYVVYSGGWCLLHLAVFYWLMDVRQWRWLGFPLAVVGVNAILIYLLTSMVDFSRPAQFLVGGLAAMLPETWADLLMVCCILMVKWLSLWFLWRKRAILKV